MGDIEPTVARILSKVECETKADITEELLNEIDDELVQETREQLFKAATSRYIELLENGSYDQTAGIPVLILKRRKATSHKLIIARI